MQAVITEQPSKMNLEMLDTSCVQSSDSSVITVQPMSTQTGTCGSVREQPARSCKTKNVTLMPSVSDSPLNSVKPSTAASQRYMEKIRADPVRYARYVVMQYSKPLWFVIHFVWHFYDQTVFCSFHDFGPSYFNFFRKTYSVGLIQNSFYGNWAKTLIGWNFGCIAELFLVEIKLPPNRN